MQSHWEALVQEDGKVVDRVAFTSDPFAALAAEAMQYPTPCIVSASASAGTDYSQHKVSISVSGPCAPREGAVETAARVSALKALQMATEVCDTVGIPNFGLRFE